MNEKPQGGTELQLGYLNKFVDAKLLDKFQICTSIPGKVPLDPNKINILWQKNSYDQPNLMPFFSDPKNHNQYDWYIFNSHWNYEKFRMVFKIPESKCIVIKNGIETYPVRKPYEKGQPIKIIYHCTPWRGLNILLLAMQYVKNPLVTLDVYSNTELYGKQFYDAHDKIYQPLYEQAKELPNVNYIGYTEHQEIRKRMQTYQMFAYPSIFEETFCISAAEALGAGLYCITTNFGALYETCSEWPIYVNYEPNHNNLAYAFGHAIEVAAEQLQQKQVMDHLIEQQKFYSKFYSWDKKTTEWTNFLTGAYNAKRSS